MRGVMFSSPHTKLKKDGKSTVTEASWRIGGCLRPCGAAAPLLYLGEINGFGRNCGWAKSIAVPRGRRAARAPRRCSREEPLRGVCFPTPRSSGGSLPELRLCRPRSGALLAGG